MPGLDYPFAVALNKSHLFWTNAGQNAIGRANLDGGQVTPIWVPDASDSYGVDVDSKHIYWGNYGSGTTIGRSTLAGKSVKQSFITGADNPTGVAVDNLPVHHH
jgi:streptogramin lyase